MSNYEPFYFGPLSGYQTEELDRRGLDQNKKNLRGFRWQATRAALPGTTGAVCTHTTFTHTHTQVFGGE